MLKTEVTNRFLRYVRVDTCSDAKSISHPSSIGQLHLAHLLADEMREMGLTDVRVEDKGYVYATLPSNSSRECPIVGFISHLDTSPDFCGKNVNPRIVEKYDGGELVLNPEKNIVLSPSFSPDLLKYEGQDLIVTDGNTLLGADDKAGIAEILTAMEYLIGHPEIEHGTIKIAFTPDEEIGEGATFFDVAGFGADFAYTLDGGEIGELEYENFNAASAKIVFHGSSVHPGYAKNKMKNALVIANQFLSMLPPTEKPEYTSGYEGFFHLTHFSGEVENAVAELIIRDFSKENFARRKKLLEKLVDVMNLRYGTGTVELALFDTYANMLEKIEPVKYIVDLAESCMREAQVEPRVVPIRGGTDGARLSYMGLPCPNLFAGGHNFHGKYEYIPIQSMAKACEVIIGIVKQVLLLDRKS